MLAGMTETHLTMAELEASLPHIRQSPKDDGVLQMIVRRPAVGEREVLDAGELDAAVGLVGDRWRSRANTDTQINIMNARAIDVIAGGRGRWPLAGDQLFVDFDLSGANAPPGTQLAIGSAVVEITEPPHTGCSKFEARFGADARTFVNSPVGRALSLRGVNAKVIQPGAIRLGDRVRKRS